MTHVAGAAPLPLPLDVLASAVYGGPDDCYRYELDWRWGYGPTLMALLMNPSVAGHDCADRTALKLYRYGQTWGCGRLLIGNVHAYRTTDQKRLALVEDPIGPDNDAYVMRMTRAADIVLVGHGAPSTKELQANGLALTRRLHEAGVEMWALRCNPGSAPWHPLYLPDAATPFRWIPGENMS